MCDRLAPIVFACAVGAAGSGEGFFAAFGVKAENRLFRAPAERIKVW